MSSSSSASSSVRPTSLPNFHLPAFHGQSSSRTSTTTASSAAYVRPVSVIGEDAKIGTFVEVKNTALGAGAKIPHLSYVGDAEVGEGTNIAAGNITANFKHEPGVPKSRTKIGRNVRTGVDNVFDAPVEIGDDSWIAPGAVITDDVPPGSLAGFAPRQDTKEGWVYDKHGKPDGD